MDPRQLDALAQRLAQNPQDAEALNAGYQHGQTDPRGYAMFLEKAGAASSDPGYAAHWYNEAATVWTASLNDVHRAARALMSAVDKDPSYALAADRLTELYRDKGDKKGVAALLERRTQGIAKLLESRPELRPELARLYGELARVWAEELVQPDKAIAAYKAAIELDPEDALSIYQVREALKALGRWGDAIPYFEREQRLIPGDPARALALYQDEAEVSRAAGKPDAVLRALRAARKLDAEDPGLKQQVAAAILERVQERARVSEEDRAEATQLFIELAEAYGGEHGYSYAGCALQCEATHDRAAQLLMFYGEQLGQELEGAPLLAGYLRANPGGAVAAQARELVARAVAAGQDQLLDALEPPDDAEPIERAGALLEVARGLARKARKREALAKYQEVLTIDPAEPEAVEFVEQHLRQGRKLADLRALLLAAAGSESAERDLKVRWLEEVAALCEGQLRDVDGAIEARRRLVLLDPSNDAAADHLQKSLEKASRWDDLAELLERRADSASDLEVKLAWDKQAAELHASKRQDFGAAGEAWARIAGATPADPSPVQTAVDFFERAGLPERAAALLGSVLAEPDSSGLADEDARIELGQKLGELRSALGDLAGAGEAFSEAAARGKRLDLWEAAQACFERAEAWEQAAAAVGERIELSPDPKEKAALCAVEAGFLQRLGDSGGVEARLERATELDPASEEFAGRLEALFVADGRIEQVVSLLLRRADQLAEAQDPDAALRTRLRMRAAHLQKDELNDREAMRASLLAVVDDAEDSQALRLLAEDFEAAGEAEAAAEFLERLVAVVPAEERLELALKQAALLAEEVGDVHRAIDRYRWISSELAPGSQVALEALARLLQRADDPSGAAEVFEQLVKASEGEAQLAAAQELAQLYESTLDQPEDAVRVLELVLSLDPEDFAAIGSLSELSERLENWPSFAKYLRMLVEVEGDELEAGRMTLRLADVLNLQLGSPAEALEALVPVADLGDQLCRDEFVRLGDELGRGSDVAKKLVEWHLESPVGPARAEALRGAFDRFAAVGQRADALKVALDLVRTKAVDGPLAEQMEQLAVHEKDLDALSAAHDLLVRELSGATRADEMVRQAEVLAGVGVASEQILQHGEQGLSSVTPAEVEPLLERLTKLAADDAAVVGLYERQVTRCKSPGDRLLALARAAEVAAERGKLDRAREFFDIALSAGAQGDQITLLLDQARQADRATGGGLRRILAEACAAGGEGARDGGRMHSMLLGRAASIAREDLGEDDLAFRWLGEALVAYVDEERLDQLEELADAVGAPGRAAEVIGEALEQVFDGPLVRLLLSRRARLRRDKLDDVRGAAEDLKRLHELSPTDFGVAEQLEALYQELGDVPGLVQLCEDQILRSKDSGTRAELATKVARLWQDELGDAREAADAWRRVLRMKSGDEEAKEGLARAKAAMLAKPAAEVSVALKEAAAAAALAPEQSAPSLDVAPSAEPTEPETTAFDATEPDVTVPEAAAFEATEPEATEPEATEPEAAAFSATEAETAEPEATAFGAPEPAASLDAAETTDEPEAAVAENVAEEELFDDGITEDELFESMRPAAGETEAKPPAPEASMESSPEASIERTGRSMPPPPPARRSSGPPPPPNRSVPPPPPPRGSRPPASAVMGRPLPPPPISGGRPLPPPTSGSMPPSPPGVSRRPPPPPPPPAKKGKVLG